MPIIDMNTSNKLKTIDEHNWYMSNQQVKPNKTGVACPKCHSHTECSSELLYLDDMILLSNPPQRNVGCEKCNFVTTIIC